MSDRLSRLWQTGYWQPNPIPSAILAGVILGTVASTNSAQQVVPVRVERWLSIQQIVGRVSYLQGQTNRPARNGDRLQFVGDGVSTGEDSTARLAVDTGIGFVNIGEQTQVRVRSLALAPDNGHITHLEVPQGQVRLQVRRFTHRGSELEIQTPAGISAVRGTEFGLVVQPDGKTGLATLEGRVASTAQGQTVVVPTGFQSLTIPGEAPLPPVPLTNSTELRYQLLRFLDRGVRRVRLLGQVDPVNQVLIDNIPQTTDRNGQFNFRLPTRSVVRVQVTVRTPLGREQIHELTLAL